MTVRLPLPGPVGTQLAEKVVCTGTYLYSFLPAQKEIKVYDITPKPGQVAEDNVLSFLLP